MKFPCFILFMKRIHWILFAILNGLFLFMFTDSLAYLFPFHEQQHLFLFSHSYFETFLSEPGGLGRYISAFFVQFFYLSFTGKVLFALILSGIYLLPTLTYQRLTKKDDPLHLALLPALYLFLQFESADFDISQVTGLFCTLSTFFLLSLFARKIFLFGLVPLFILPGYFFGWISPAISLLIIILSTLSALSISRLAQPSKKVNMSCSLLSLSLYASLGFYIFIHTYNMRERLLIEADLHIQKQNWEQVIICAHKYKGENQLMDYFRNMALFHNGRMPYDLLNYQQSFGTGSLFLPWTGDAQSSKYGHYIYEQLGYINEAQRWATEALVVYGETAPTLVNLIRYNIVNGRPEVAMRFIRKLKQSLFYSKQAAEFEKIVPTGQVPGLKPLSHPQDEKAHFTNILNIGPELLYICDHDSSNQMAFEYLMSNLLLTNRLSSLAENIKRIDAFSYPEIPPLYKKALDTYKQNQK